MRSKNIIKIAILFAVLLIESNSVFGQANPQNCREIAINIVDRFGFRSEITVAVGYHANANTYYVGANTHNWIRLWNVNIDNNNPLPNNVANEIRTIERAIRDHEGNDNWNLVLVAGDNTNQARMNNVPGFPRTYRYNMHYRPRGAQTEGTIHAETAVANAFYERNAGQLNLNQLTIAANRAYCALCRAFLEGQGAQFLQGNQYTNWNVREGQLNWVVGAPIGRTNAVYRTNMPTIREVINRNRDRYRYLGAFWNGGNPNLNQQAMDQLLVQRDLDRFFPGRCGRN